MERPVEAKQERSVRTRAKLIDAVLDEVAEVGMKAATTERFARRAGVSRGAMLHHFPSRDDIISTAMQHMLRGATAEIRDRVGDVNAGSMTISDLLDFIWSIYRGRFFHLSLELVVEARSNPQFHEKMAPVLKEFHDALDNIWMTLVRSEDISARRAVTVLNLTLCLMRGMGVQTVLRPEWDYYREMISLWKELMPRMLEGTDRKQQVLSDGSCQTNLA